MCRVSSAGKTGQRVLLRRSGVRIELRREGTVGFAIMRRLGVKEIDRRNGPWRLHCVLPKRHM